MPGSILASTVCQVFLRRLFDGKFTLPIDGVYRSGFATTQPAYEKAVVEVFDALDKVEKILTGKDYLVGDILTEADVRLWVTIVCLNSIIGFWIFVLIFHGHPVRFGSIPSTLVTSSAISAQSVTDILLSTSVFQSHPKTQY